MQLVDSNILFGLYMAGTPWHEAARALHAADPHWRSEGHALVEMSNILARYVRAHELTAAQALHTMLEAGERFGPDLIAVPHTDALRLAIKHNISAYDARFLLCAGELRLPLVTEDVRLRNAAPHLTQSLADALAALS
jgi:predicted nucleic acid-binding protein